MINEDPSKIFESNKLEQFREQFRAIDDVSKTESEIVFDPLRPDKELKIGRIREPTITDSYGTIRDLTLQAFRNKYPSLLKALENEWNLVEGALKAASDLKKVFHEENKLRHIMVANHFGTNMMGFLELLGPVALKRLKDMRAPNMLLQ